MWQRYRHLATIGKAKVVVTAAIVQEIVGFIWTTAKAATAAPTRSRPELINKMIKTKEKNANSAFLRRSNKPKGQMMATVDINNP